MGGLSKPEWSPCRTKELNQNNSSLQSPTKSSPKKRFPSIENGRGEPTSPKKTAAAAATSGPGANKYGTWRELQKLSKVSDLKIMNYLQVDHRGLTLDCVDFISVFMPVYPIHPGRDKLSV